MDDFFGFTTKLADLEVVRTWRDAAVADGWEETDMDNDPRRRRSKLTRDGFVAHTVTRDNSDKPGAKHEAKVSVWGPDSLAVSVPTIYSFDALVANTRRCSSCRKRDVETHRVGFAGRVCVECLPEQRKRVETPGWNN